MAIDTGAHAPSRTASAGAAPRRSASGRRRRTLRRLPVRIALGLLLVVEIYPMLWMFLTSLKSQSGYLDNSTWSLPTHWQWGNYAQAWNTGHIGLYVRNSLIAVLPSLALIVVLGTAAGFGLQVMVWKRRNLTLILFLAGIMVPSQMILLPLFTIYYQAGLSGTLWPLIITYTGTGLPLTVFMMATYYRSLPLEVFEACTLDGAGILRSFLSISVPMMRNAILTVALVQFFFVWNDLLIALTFTNTQDLSTVQVGLLNFNGNFGTVQYGPLFAGICINVFGTLAVYLVLNQKVMKGLTGGAVKG
jgi:raffinose/stachyose/melibiose transport system permease protein